MQPILKAKYIKEWDEWTIRNEPIRSVDLMERAAVACFDWLMVNFPHADEFLVFCGTGNNGGDGLAIARKLLQIHKKVSIVIAGEIEQASEDFKVNYNRLKQLNNLKVFSDCNQLSVISPTAIIIDAIFGTGLNRPITGLAEKCVNFIGGLPNSVIAIDSPSGIYVDRFTDEDLPVVKANVTLTFQSPKLAFFMPENSKWVGEWYVLDIGLDSGYDPWTKTNMFVLERKDLSGIFCKRQKFDSKWTFGHGLLIGGSKDKPGSIILSAGAALRSGIGLLTVHSVESVANFLIPKYPEAMMEIDSGEKFIQDVVVLDRYSGIGFGPGLGTHAKTVDTIRNLLDNHSVNMVIDADALNIISKERLHEWLPKNTILTPHVKEFERLTQEASNSFERLDIQLEFSRKYQVYTLLKGAYSKLSTPDGRLIINSTGNPGMAKGGSGDVLTGMITSFLAQGIHPEKATLSAMYVHGLAGDIVKQKKGEIGMLPSDLIEVLPEILNSLES